MRHWTWYWRGKRWGGYAMLSIEGVRWTAGIEFLVPMYGGFGIIFFLPMIAVCFAACSPRWREQVRSWVSETPLQPASVHHDVDNFYRQ